MSWYEKEATTPFDNQEIPGLWFLDGDILAELVGRDWTRGQKLPLIAFPSGLEHQIWPTSNRESLAIVHLFGELDLPLKADLDQVEAQAQEIAEACGYQVSRVGESSLQLTGHDQDENLTVTYDPATGMMVNVEPVAEAYEPPQMELLPEEAGERLPKFSLGQLVATPGALESLQEAQQSPLEFLVRHVTGDWGDLGEEDKQENEFSVENGFRILSAYTLSSGQKVWVITEADRSVTTILLPSEY